MTRVAAIVPAYNEEVTIAEVVRVLLDAPIIDEVIVVDDGSADTTAQQARDAGARVFVFSENKGKGEALSFGVQQTDAPVVAFFDADLLGFTTEHVSALLSPVLDDGWVMSCSLRDRGVVRTWMTKHLPLISGERVLRREVIEKLPVELLRGYMVEATMNYHCRSQGWRYGAVALPGLFIRKKFEKVSFFQAVIEYLRMFLQVGMAMILVRIAHLRGKF